MGILSDVRCALQIYWNVIHLKNLFATFKYLKLVPWDENTLEILWRMISSDLSQLPAGLSQIPAGLSQIPAGLITVTNSETKLYLTNEIYLTSKFQRTGRILVTETPATRLYYSGYRNPTDGNSAYYLA